MTENDEYQII